MAERFVYPPTAAHPARVSIDADASVAIFTDTALANHDWAGAQLWITPDDAAPYRVGTIAEVSPQGAYENLELPLFRPWRGAAISSAKFELVDGLALAGGATQAGIYARFAAFLQQAMGLVGNKSDTIDFALVPNNSLFVDDVTRTLYQWRAGVLEVVQVIGAPWDPKGTYNGATPYAKNALVSNVAGTGVFISGHDTNTGNTPPAVGASNSHWTYLPLPSGPAGADGSDGAPGAAVVTGTSNASLAIETGPKDFPVVEALARGWAIGTRLRATSPANPTRWMEGTVTTYNHPALTIDVDKINGSDTYADWSISLVGQPGADGAPGASGTSTLSRVRVVATTNVAIASGLEAGDTIDGVTLTTGDLVLLAGQTAATENGVYVVPASGAAARHTDFDAYNELAGAYFSVMEGTAKHDTLWCCTSDRGGTIGVTALVIAEFKTGSSVVPSYLTGLTLSNNASDGANDIDISPGAAADNANAATMALTSWLTKRLDAAWAVGSGNGGLDAGSIANTTYHVFLIQRSDTGVVDALFSTSATAPTMPANYDRKRRIGSIIRAAGTIRPFVQNGDLFRWKGAAINDGTMTNPGTSAIALALSVPAGIVVEADIVVLVAALSNLSILALITSFAETDRPAGPGDFTVGVAGGAAGNQNGLPVRGVYTNTAGQVRVRLNNSAGSDTIVILTFGWIDTRGK
ncbi:hypothetical protein RA307_31670 [Xanthobacteraceae bacterium Astr-EGSB]|uniref:hypothetical protein n=1 Tax=Astrobacterium formosum TaxID=3069710 RepID=UPI0027B583E5|nr:hypothetical protein [Xanthobacteraceae bacterium Astr-EGSB]